MLEKAFISAFNAILENKEHFNEAWKKSIAGDDVLKRVKAAQLMKLMKKAKPITEFNTELFHRLIEKMTVSDGKKVLVTLLDGAEVECLTI